MKKLKFDPKWNNVPVKPIGLEQWLKDHPSEAAKNSPPCFFYGVNPDPDKRRMNATQMAHLKGDINIYEPIEAYSIKWFHKGDTYYSIPQSKTRNDLPPVYIQWKDDYRKRNARTKRNNRTNISSWRKKR